MENELTTVKKEKYVPVKEYADRHGITLQAVYQALKRGTLRGKKIGSYQLVKV